MEKTLLVAAAAFLAIAAAPSRAMEGADQADAACPAIPQPLPAGLEGWTRKASARAGGTAARATMLPLGEGVLATLLPAARIAYPVPPEKPGGRADSGGLFAFVAPAAGRYRVALGSAAWVDVIAGAAAVASVAHGHGPACAGMRKTVDFDLKPGRHLLQIAGSGPATLRLMVTRAP